MGTPRLRVILSPDERVGLLDTIEPYREWLYGLGLNSKTVTVYTLRVRQLVQWCHENHFDALNLKPSQLAEFTEICPAQSRRQLRSAMQHYWSMFGMEGTPRAIRVPPKPQPRWRGLEPDEAAKLIKVARRHAPRGGIVLIGIYLALRREEIVGLRWADFDRDIRWVTVIGKFDIQKTLPVHPRLRTYLRYNRWDHKWVFPGRFGGHIAAATVNLWLDEFAEEAGIGHVHPHQLRYTSIERVRKVAGLEVARPFAGHLRIESTQWYTRTTIDEMQAAMHAFDGLEDDDSAA